MSTILDTRTDQEKALDAIVLARVKAGIMKLERAYGPNWVEKFGGMEDFNIRHGSYCVLGKIYGHYGDGLAKLRIRDTLYSPVNKQGKGPFAVDLGFNGGTTSELDALQKIWEQELTKLGVK